MVGWTDLSIKYRLIILFLLVGLLPGLVIGILSYNGAKAGLIDLEYKALAGLSDTKGQAIEEYFLTIEKQVVTFSNSRMIVEAAKEFREPFHDYVRDNGVTSTDLDRYQRSVENYYETNFLPTLEENVDFAVSLPMFWQGEDVTTALQYHYLSNNPNPAGSKNGLDKANDGSEYSEIHEIYHPIINQYLEKFGYYDIFILDHETGHIIYSVFKEVDYATSLLTGPYKDTNFADVFRAAAASNNPDEFFIEDFKPYNPSYHTPASFIASPVFDGDEKVGVLVFQMPVDNINNVMTNNNRWEENGLGKTGEAYLLGPDKLMRSMSRELIEHPDLYFEELEKAGHSDEEINNIRRLGTTIINQEVNTKFADNAAAGETNTGLYKDSLGHSAIVSYAPLEIPGLQYSIVTRIDEHEALHAVDVLRAQVTWILVIAAIIIAVIAFFAAVSVIKPINKVKDRLKEIAQGEGDLTARMNIAAKDETGQLAHWFDVFVGSIQDLLLKVSESSQNSAAVAEELSASSEEVNSSTQQIATTMQEIAKGGQTLSDTATKTQAKTDELIMSINMVTENAQNANGLAQEASTNAQDGQKAANEAGQRMQAISQSVETSAKQVKELGDKTEEIHKIIEVINGISEQTNLLALNAAIEAARAGEAGRGFAVVADEVRKLAEESQQATKRIEDMINDIIATTQATVTSMEKGTTEVDQGSQVVSVALDTLAQIGEKVKTVAGQIGEISSATQEQSAAAQQVQEEIKDVTKVSEQSAAASEEVSASVEETSASVQQVAESAQNLSKSADELKQLIGKFKLK